MENAIYKIEYPEHIKAILEELVDFIHSSGPGVTLSGNRLTVRWVNSDRKFVDVHMIIESVNDGEKEDIDLGD